MGSVKIDGREYTLRCDINVLERLSAEYGDIGRTDFTMISVVKFTLAAMINEHNYYTGHGEDVTPEYIGARIAMHEMPSLSAAVIAELRKCVSAKN